MLYYKPFSRVPPRKIDQTDICSLPVWIGYWAKHQFSSIHLRLCFCLPSKQFTSCMRMKHNSTAHTSCILAQCIVSCNVKHTTIGYLVYRIGNKHIKWMYIFQPIFSTNFLHCVPVAMLKLVVYWQYAKCFDWSAPVIVILPESISFQREFISFYFQNCFIRISPHSSEWKAETQVKYEQFKSEEKSSCEFC